MALLPPDPVFTLKNSMGHLHTIKFLENADKTATCKLMAAGENGIVYIWDLETNRLIQQQKLGESIQSLHSIDTNLIIQEKIGLLTLWQLNDNQQYEKILTYKTAGGYCKIIEIDQQLIVPQIDSKIDLIDQKTLKLNKQLLLTTNTTTNHNKLGLAMCLQDVRIDGTTLILVGYESGDVLLWHPDSSKLNGRIRLDEYITTITFDPERRRGVCGNPTNKLQVFTIDHAHKFELKCELNLTNPGCSVIRLRGDAKILASGGWDGRLRLFSWKTLRSLVVLDEHRGATISDIQFSKTIVNRWGGCLMAACGSDGIISLWNLY